VARRTVSARSPAGMVVRRGRRWLVVKRCHESAVPAQDRCGRDEKTDPAVAGESADERGDHCPVRPGHLRCRGLAARHCELVAENDNLDVLVRC
jgi:hypothetical protein